MQLPSRGQLALGATSLLIGGRLISKRLPSQYLCGFQTLFASTSLANNGATNDGTAGPEPEVQPSSVQYSLRVQVNSAAVWGICGILVCSLGAWLKSPQIAQLGKNGILGTLALVVGSLAIYRSDMMHLESSLKADIDKVRSDIDKVRSAQEQMMIKLTEISCTLYLQNSKKK